MWRLRTRATRRRQTTAAAAIDRAVIDSIEWAKIRQDGDRQDGKSEGNSRA
jgi:hypothetical protein